MRQFLVVPHEGGFKGFNPDLVCSFEVDEKGYALCRMIDGSHFALQPDQWKQVASTMRPPEPQAAQNAGNPTGGPPAT